MSYRWPNLLFFVWAAETPTARKTPLSPGSKHVTCSASSSLLSAAVVSGKFMSTSHCLTVCTYKLTRSTFYPTVRSSRRDTSTWLMERDIHSPGLTERERENLFASHYNHNNNKYNSQHNWGRLPERHMVPINAGCLYKFKYKSRSSSSGDERSTPVTCSASSSLSSAARVAACCVLATSPEVGLFIYRFTDALLSEEFGTPLENCWACCYGQYE